jgi:hypothetical protein
MTPTLPERLREAPLGILTRSWAAQAGKTRAYDEAFKTRLRQTSHEAACWGALFDVGLAAEARACQTLVRDAAMRWAFPEELDDLEGEGNLEPALGGVPEALGSPCVTCRALGQPHGVCRLAIRLGHVPGHLVGPESPSKPLPRPKTRDAHVPRQVKQAGARGWW